MICQRLYRKAQAAARLPISGCVLQICTGFLQQAASIIAKQYDSLTSVWLFALFVSLPLWSAWSYGVITLQTEGFESQEKNGFEKEHSSKHATFDVWLTPAFIIHWTKRRQKKTKTEFNEIVISIDFKSISLSPFR